MRAPAGARNAVREPALEPKDCVACRLQDERPVGSAYSQDVPLSIDRGECHRSDPAVQAGALMFQICPIGLCPRVETVAQPYCQGTGGRGICKGRAVKVIPQIRSIQYSGQTSVSTADTSSIGPRNASAGFSIPKGRTRQFPHPRGFLTLLTCDRVSFNMFQEPPCTCVAHLFSVSFTHSEPSQVVLVGRRCPLSWRAAPLLRGKVAFPSKSRILRTGSI